MQLEHNGTNGNIGSSGKCQYKEKTVLEHSNITAADVCWEKCNKSISVNK